MWKCTFVNEEKTECVPLEECGEGAFGNPKTGNCEICPKGKDANMDKTECV